jgi:hypothetical protein
MDIAARPGCAFADCGRPDCPVCAWGRVSPAHPTASTVDPMAADAVAEPAPVRARPIWMPKKRHRIGPLR